MKKILHKTHLTKIYKKCYNDKKKFDIPYIVIDANENNFEKIYICYFVYYRYLLMQSFTTKLFLANDLNSFL